MSCLFIIGNKDRIGMKYRDLKIGDVFVIKRDMEKGTFVKKEFYIQDVNDPKKAFRRLHGLTEVELVRK